MERPMTQIDILTDDDPLYRELYDVRREAEVMGNFIDHDPMPAIARLREKAPVYEGSLRDILHLPEHFRHVMARGRKAFSVLSYDACIAAFRDPERFSSRISHHPNPDNEQTMGILEMDGSQHRAYRRTIQPRFLMTEALSWWRQRFIGDIINTLVDHMAKSDRAELNLAFCARIPVHTGGTGRVTPEVQREAAATIQRMLLALIGQRRAERKDDLISFLIDTRLQMPGQDPRPLTDKEIMTHARLVMIAGGGTSWRQLGITLWALLSHVDQYEEVKANRALLEDAIEESLRWNPTAPVFSRMVMRDTEFFGVPMPEGAVLEICLGSANRDPKYWDRPDEFDMHRKQHTNLAFGMGKHRCLGMNVARVEMAVGIEALMDAFPNMRLDPDQPAPFLTGGLEQRGISGLPVLLR